ncbi:MAG: hypothetical protein ACI97N_000507 [Cognaticolwellia sp.]|jgi:hypothetical protein
MPIEIKELVIRANIDRQIGQKKTGFSEEDKLELKKEVLAYCLNKLRTKENRDVYNHTNSINR